MTDCIAEKLILFEEFAEIRRFEITDNLAFFEYRKRAATSVKRLDFTK